MHAVVTGTASGTGLAPGVVLASRGHAPSSRAKSTSAAARLLGLLRLWGRLLLRRWRL